jgi:putative toxin-antitoxin system antitoxin component (TIGR02293 family)
MARTWAPTIDRLGSASDAGALRDVDYLLRRLVDVYGNNTVAGILGVGRAMVTRWLRHGAPVSSTMTRRILDVHAVLVRALRLFSERNAAQWLFGSEPHLGGARPIDVLVLRGASQVVEALEAIEQGAFA